MPDETTLRRALRRYATQGPLDLKPPSQLRRELLCILGQRHIHEASIGSDECCLCGHDIREDVHLRVGETP